MSDLKVGIIGMGPIGSILAAHLSNGGFDVHIVDIFDPRINSIKVNGIWVVGNKELHATITKTYSSIDQLFDKEIDYLFICTKTGALHGIIKYLEGFDLDKTDFISFQNGLDAEEVIAARFPRKNVFRGVVNCAGMLLRDGVVHMTFFNPPNYIGNLVPESEDTARDIVRLFDESGFETHYTDNIKKAAWRKAILNSSLAPICLITRMSMGKAMEFSGTREVVGQLIEEYIDVARAEGHDMGADFYEKSMYYLAQGGDHKPTLLMDFEKDNPIELDSHNGKIQEYADKHGLPCKINQAIISLIKGLLLQRDIVAGSH